MDQRSSGILLPILSLPGPYGIGDFGPGAYRFVDWLHAAGQKHWVILPLLIPDSTGSPFGPPSTYALNWLHVSPERLVEDGLLPQEQLNDAVLNDGEVDYPSVHKAKRHVLGLSWWHFKQHGGEKQRSAFARFRTEHASWLQDYALFAALKDRHNGRPWTTWNPELRERHPSALRAWRVEHEDEVGFFTYLQWLTMDQWEGLKTYANERDVQIIGNLPHFVTHDSADVWCNRALFKLDDAGNPTAVAGVPPDYYSTVGQLWGNPLYDWRAHEEEGFRWWTERLRHTLSLYDEVVLDHFRGFKGVWEVPLGSQDARSGAWATVPGGRLFEKLRTAFPSLPFIIEDLGSITKDVHEFREALGLPGMRVAVFGLKHKPDAWNFPPNFPENSISYTSTHDAHTARGWLDQASGEDRAFALDYTDALPETFAWNLVRETLKSKSRLAVAPLQDVLGLGNEARMNTPGTKVRNWTWRLSGHELTETLAEKLRHITQSAHRL